MEFAIKIIIAVCDKLLNNFYGSFHDFIIFYVNRLVTNE